MYELAMRLLKSRMNSSFSAGDTWVQYPPSEMRDISSKSKSDSVTWRICARRWSVDIFGAAVLPCSGKTCFTATCTVSVGLAAAATPADVSSITIITLSLIGLVTLITLFSLRDSPLGEAADSVSVPQVPRRCQHATNSY